MRTPLATLVLVAACGADDGMSPPHPPRPDAAPARFDGDWQLSWSCVATCGAEDPRPGLAPFLRIAGATLTFGGEPGGIGDVDNGAADGNCIDVPDDMATSGSRKRAYRLCGASDAGGDLIEATVPWTLGFAPDVTDTTWRLRGRRI